MSVARSTLGNGLTVVTETIESVRSITIGIWVKTGSRDETDAQAGITHFLEHMLFKGTSRRNAFQIAQSLESVGGYLNAMTSTEYTCYYARCLDSQVDLAVDVLCDMIFNSVFPPEEILKEKKVVLEEMKMYRDSPDDVVFEEFSQQMFPSDPLGRPIIGFEQTVSAFTQEDLRSYLHAHYDPSSLLVSVAGNVSHQAIVDLVGRAVESWAVTDGVGTGRMERVVPPVRTVDRQRTITRPIEQTHMIIGRRGLRYDDDARMPLLLANTVLSGGMSSRLHQNIREKYGYCYTVSSFSQSYTDTGMFGVYIGTDKEYVPHVRELIAAEFNRLMDEPIPDQEWAESKTQLKGKLLLAQESMSNRMTRLAKSELYFGRFISLDELVEEIDAVTREQVQAFSREFFPYESFCETLLLPESKD